MRISFKTVFLALMVCTSPCLYAISSLEEQAEKTLDKIYHTLESMPNKSMVKRLEFISYFFLGRPYILGSLGEGEGAEIDQFPRFRTDSFDCETYVTTVLAAALSNNNQEFQYYLLNIRYFKGVRKYINRNHFTDLDWNGNNQKQGFVKDITMTFLDENKKPLALIAQANIDKSSWYSHMSINQVRLISPNIEEQQKRLNRLKLQTANLPVETAQIPYLPLTALFYADGRPNKTLFQQIPNASIIEIIRPNWDLTKQIGTHLNISHLGFAFWKKDQLVFRGASSEYSKVVDVPLIEYLYKARNSPTIRGINVQIIVPEQPGKH